MGNHPQERGVDRGIRVPDDRPNQIQHRLGDFRTMRKRQHRICDESRLTGQPLDFLSRFPAGLKINRRYVSQ